MDRAKTQSSSIALNELSHMVALLSCVFFISAGQAFVPLLGIQNDEALFAQPLFDRAPALYSVGRSSVPLMIMSYVGALKTWIYAPIFRLFHTGVWQLREPTILMGAVSIWWFYLLLRRVAGIGAAVIGTCLLAVDSDYLLTVCYDWGPVAMQHLLLIGGILLVVRFCQNGRPIHLIGGFFLLGLAMWDKALAVWMLSGATAAALVVYGRPVVSLFDLRRVTVAAAAFCLGAAPLIAFNIHSDMRTFHQNIGRDNDRFSSKARFLGGAIAGGGLFGYLEWDNWQTISPHIASSAAERASSRLSDIAGHPHHSGMTYALVAALLLAPFAGWQAMRAVLFCALMGTISWLEMAWNANTGGSIHHTILLWPLPQSIVAISFAGISRRFGKPALCFVAAGLLCMMTMGILVTNEYHVQMARNGGTVSWSPALFRLSDDLKAFAPKEVFCMDWGILNSLLLLQEGHLKLHTGSDLVFPKRNLNAEERIAIGEMLAQSNALFVSHTPDMEFFQGANETLIQIASQMGYRRQLLTMIPDGYGRAIFEVYRMVH